MSALQHFTSFPQIPGQTYQAIAIRFTAECIGIHEVLDLAHAALELEIDLIDAEAREFLHHQPPDVRYHRLVDVQVAMVVC